MTETETTTDSCPSKQIFTALYLVGESIFSTYWKILKTPLSEMVLVTEVNSRINKSSGSFAFLYPGQSWIRQGPIQIEWSKNSDFKRISFQINRCLNRSELSFLIRCNYFFWFICFHSFFFCQLQNWVLHKFKRFLFPKQGDKYGIFMGRFKRQIKSFRKPIIILKPIVKDWGSHCGKYAFCTRIQEIHVRTLR